MKFIYEYRTKDNVRHTDTIVAPNREAAFAILKQRGIRPGSVADAPGLFNKLFGKGKRWMAIVVLAALALASTLVALNVQRKIRNTEYAERSQIYGDPSVLQAHEAKRWADVFSDPLDLYLAQYAVPGRKVESVTKPEGDLSGRMGSVEFTSDDSEEVRKMKRIVNGMKREMREYVAAGGSPAVYLERVTERQSVEVSLLLKFEGDLAVLRRRGDAATDRREVIGNWNSVSKLMREMGFKSVPVPEEWEGE